MTPDVLAELVSGYADHRSPAHRQTLLRLFPEQANVLRELLDITDALAAFFSVHTHRPTPVFRAELKRELLAEMERRLAQEDKAPPSSSHSGRRYLAAAVGVGSAAVVVAAGALVYWRHRHTAMAA
ncbi:MAG: hypothetical protein Q9O62_04775 [Ardenticatenia bacterium]|nr:hypothetical protein [Ardenticatenia bacterium]